MSLFTRALIEGIESGQADLDRDGLISVEELHEYAFDALAKRGVEQHPAKYVQSQEGTFFVARTPAADVANTYSTLADGSESEQSPTISHEPRVRRGEIYAGYSADDLSSIDQLGFNNEVRALATLITSKRFSPPLSIGLFGDCGSGKSFFMRQLRERVAFLADSSRAAEESVPPRASYYCSSIAQIEFNAWHYVDANLWASLATRIFQGISEHIQATADEPNLAYQALLAQLDSSLSLLREAEQRRRDAEAALERARSAAQAERQSLASRKLDALIASHPEVAGAVSTLSDELGLTEAATNVRDIAGAVSSIAERGPWSRVWAALHGESGESARRRAALVFGLSIIIGIVFTVAFILNDRLIPAILTPLLGAITAITTAIKVVSDKTAKMVRAGQELILADRTDEQRALAAADEAVGRAKQKVADIEGELSDLRSPGSSTLYRFVTDRYTSAEYREYMGVLSLVQRDFSALSDLLAPRAERGGTTEGSPLIPRVDRVVLYIDDLDRCPADKVVQVLQAVHLMLALPLFVVVVGVDSRWLVGALEVQYAPEAHPGRREGSNQLARMPQDYLEKIFQIPLWIPEMRSEGYQQLVRALLDTELDAAADGEARPDVALSTRRSQTSIATQDRAGVSTEQAEGLDDLAPNTLLIREEEVAFLETLGGFVRTPRTAKRLTNVYRLLKVSVDRDELRAFEGSAGVPGEYRAVIALAAVSTGFPDLTGYLFEALYATEESSWSRLVDSLIEREQTGQEQSEGADSDQWAGMSVARRLDLLEMLRSTAHRIGVDHLEVYRKWAPRVARYSFSGGWWLRQSNE